MLDTNNNPVVRSSDVISLREHIREMLNEIDKRYEQRFNAQEAATKAALASASLAVDKSETNANKWRENANEWRGAMSDKDKLFTPRTEILPRLEKIDGVLGELKTVRDIAIGKASQNSVIVSYILSILALILGIFHLWK